MGKCAGRLTNTVELLMGLVDKVSKEVGQHAAVTWPKLPLVGQNYKTRVIS